MALVVVVIQDTLDGGVNVSALGDLNQDTLAVKAATEIHRILDQILQKEQSEEENQN